MLHFCLLVRSNTEYLSIAVQIILNELSVKNRWYLNGYITGYTLTDSYVHGLRDKAN